MIKALCPRFERHEDALNWLAEQVPEYKEVYKLLAQIETTPSMGGIPVFQQDIVEELNKIKKLPIWFGEKVFELEVEPRQLYWKVETEYDEELAEEFGLEFEDYYAATSLLTYIIELNVSATYVFSSWNNNSDLQQRYLRKDWQKYKHCYLRMQQDCLITKICWQ